jgi:tetratricopeptide (TPR) repeat protein
MSNGATLRSTTDQTVARARIEGEAEQERIAMERAATAGTALATCAPELCDAISRGELAIGMSEAQVLASTRTTTDAWNLRGTGRTRVMSAQANAGTGPSDAVAEIAYIAMQDGRVRSYTYREPQGFRTVATPGDATGAARAASQADAMLREGDAFALRGDFVGALDRYDRADVLRPNDGQTSLRIARTLDKQLRPVEAELQYRRALQQLQIELIRAEGEVAARIAEAIALTHQRIIVLERR